MSSSSNRPRFTDSELESLRLWATPNFGADGSYEEEIEEEELLLIEEEPLVPQLTVEEIEAIQKQAQSEGFAVGKRYILQEIIILTKKDTMKMCISLRCARINW